jgi:hypothetical protein
LGESVLGSVVVEAEGLGVDIRPRQTRKTKGCP